MFSTTDVPAVTGFAFGIFVRHPADGPHRVMSALPLKADMCSALANVGYGPEADIASVDYRKGRTPVIGHNPVRA
jgi:hypothetical protein